MKKSDLLRSVDPFTRAYLDCAIWSSCHPHTSEPLDRTHDTGSLTVRALKSMIADCAAFQQANEPDLLEGEDSQAGHDFWATRNGHGCGFWDGDWPEPAATRLTDAAHAFGESTLLPWGRSLDVFSG